MSSASTTSFSVRAFMFLNAEALKGVPYILAILSYSQVVDSQSSLTN